MGRERSPLSWRFYLLGALLVVCSSSSVQAQSGKLAGYWETPRLARLDRSFFMSILA
jgi:hypothetical protein